MATDFPELDLRAALARIDHERAETEKFAAETHKLLAEAAKLGEETNRAIAMMPERYRLENAKLEAETRKFNRDPWFIAAAAIIAGCAAIGARLPEILHSGQLPQPIIIQIPPPK